MPRRSSIRSLIVAPLVIGIALGSAVAIPHSAPHPPAPTTFHNPVLWEDLADADIIRVGSVYYYSASNMHYSPGAPILRSYDLVNWEFVGHSVPSLDFGSAYDLNGGNEYARGTWASFFGYRKSSKTFYWGGCIDFQKTYIYTAAKAEGPWTRIATLPKCYYDVGLLIDDDDTMYLAYGNTTLNVAQLSPDGTSEVKSQVVFNTPPDVKVLEGSRFYKVNGNYYIFTTRPPDSEYVLKSTSGPFGPYTMRPLVVRAAAPVAGAGSPHQGAIVQTQHHDWFYMAFIDAYPGGRVPVLAPLKWNADGWPELQIAGNAWGRSYPYPLSFRRVDSPTGTDHFHGRALGPEWEWNHNPDNAKWSLDHGLNLGTATVTQDLYSARNTLTHRILGPQSTATIELDDTAMKDGDRAGLALFRESSAWVGVVRENGAYKVVMENNLTVTQNWKQQWQTTGTGTEVASQPISAGRIWLRASADIHPGPGHTAHFSWSSDGRNFEPIGSPFVLETEWQFFMGYRFAIFNYATQSLGGKVRVSSFKLAAP